MQEAYVELLCPNCEKSWEESANDMPDPKEPFTCPDCATERRTAEFARTERDLEVLREL
jgi:predicted RNA-binding Zn-ribbon protein involved in translation (DUF1610 family)